MVDARRTIFAFVGELMGAMGDLLVGAGAWVEGTARRYFAFLWKATKVFGVGAAILIVLLVAGALTGQEWLVSTATILIGACAALFLLLASPVGVLVAKLGREVEDVRKYLTGVGGLLLWALLLGLYFSIVPVSNRPAAILLVMLVTLIVGLFWSVHGIGPNPRRIYASVILVFVITTVSFFFPKTFSAAIGLRGRLDEMLAECLTRPSMCFSQQAAPQDGVRAVELLGQDPGAERKQTAARPPSEPPKATAVSLEVRSDPEGVDVYLDWASKGRTPLRLEGRNISGLLVLAKEGHRASFNRIDYREDGHLELNLPTEGKRSRTHLLLLGSEGASSESVSSLRSRLVEQGFTVLGAEAAREFEQEKEKAGGGLSHRGFRAWARTRFDTDVLVIARFRKSSRALGEQELRYLGIQRGVRAEVDIDLEAIDLRTGDHLTAVSGKGSSLALDYDQGLQKALAQAAAESAKLLRQQIRG